MTPLPKVVKLDELTIPAPGEGVVTYADVDDQAFDAMIAKAYAHIRQNRGEGVRISLEDLASCQYAREALIHVFERDAIPYAADMRDDGAWRIRCVATESLIEIRLDVIGLCALRN